MSMDRNAGVASRTIGEIAIRDSVPGLIRKPKSAIFGVSVGVDMIICN